jgi:ribosomal protein S18 acetylase RimI-like enzyme
VTAAVPQAATDLATALLETGFAPADGAPFTLDMRRDTVAVPDVLLPDGFTLRAMASGENGALAACHRAAWDPHALPWAPASRPVVATDATSHFSEDDFAMVRATWPFRQELVTVVEAPDGTLAASCIAWLDDENGAAEIEPLGVVPAFRGLGLGRAVCLGAVRAVGRHDGAEVVIHPRGDDAYPAPRRLYARCGFHPVSATRPLVRAAGHDRRPQPSTGAGHGSGSSG